MSKKFRAFCFTLNNYKDEHIFFLENLSCQYICFGKEVAPTTNTPHLQGYVYFVNPRSHASVKRLAPWYISPSYGSTIANVDYCGKEGAFYERGEKPSDPGASGIAEIDRWNQARKSAEAGEFNAVPSDIYIRCYNTIHRMHKPPVEDLPESPFYGMWIYGPPRTGKSHYVRTQFTPLYLKDLNKWWDGYENEPYVLIDEMNPEAAKYLVTFLKKWIDRWRFSAEYKGGTSIIRPKFILITSNYKIEECFDGVDLDALKQRMNLKNMLKRELDN